MKDILQDDEGVILVGGDLVLDGGVDGVAQQAEIRLNTNKGEWWLDESQGLPWVVEAGGIMGSKLPADIVAKMVQCEGMKTDDVSDIKITSAVRVGPETEINFDLYAGTESRGVTVGTRK
ncbi:hypothetical protein D3C76_1121880 [compost metagenome]